MLDYKTSQEQPEVQETPADILSTEKRSRAIRIMYIVAILMFIVTITQSVINFLRYDAWQILADGSFNLIALLLIFRSWRLYSKGLVEEPKNFIPFAILLAFVPGELFLLGVTAYNLITGILLFGLSFVILQPKRRNLWLTLFATFLAIEFLFSRLSILPRFNIYTVPGWPESLPVISLILGIVFLSQLFTTVRLRTIQSRMLVSIISLALVPAVIIGTVTMYLGFQENIGQVESNLRATSLLKIEQINAWLSQSTSDLNSLLQKTEFLNNVSLLPYFTQENYYFDEIRVDMTAVMENTGNFNKMYIIGPDGTVLLSTDPEIQRTNLAESDIFINGWEGTYITPAAINPVTNTLEVQVAIPVILSTGEVSSVLVGDLNPTRLLEITADATNLGSTGESFLLESGATLLTPVRYSSTLLPGQAQIALENESLFGVSTETATSQYYNYDNQAVIGSYTWLPALNSSLVLEQRQTEAFESINFIITLVVIIALVTAVIAIFFAVTFTRSVATPLMDLSNTAHLVSVRELETMQPIDRDDEIGELSRSLSTMTDEMLQTSQNLEKIVAERTAVLERRAAYLETTAEIGRAITNIRNLEDLLTTVTHLISEKFGFYHVGVFIIDTNREFAVLKAANSEGGWRMLARDHRLKVGEQGIVGYVTGTGQPRIQQQVAGEDSVYYNNPDLPMTKSEMALPMTSAGEILGCLDVQSTEEQAFSDEDIRVLQVLADEVAVAITNTNLFQQLQESLETERRVFGQITQESWRAILQQQQGKYGYRADRKGVQMVTDIKLPESHTALQTGSTIKGSIDPSGQTYPLSVPIKVRGGLVVAVIETEKPVTAGPWTSEEIAVLEGVGEQLGVALENARLFEETQKNAQRERIAADLSGKIWASTDIDTILQTAVRELGSALSATEGSISLSIGEGLTGTDNSNDGTGEA